MYNGIQTQSARVLYESKVNFLIYDPRLDERGITSVFGHRIPSNKF